MILNGIHVDGVIGEHINSKNISILDLKDSQGYIFSKEPLTNSEIFQASLDLSIKNNNFLQLKDNELLFLKEKTKIKLLALNKKTSQMFCIESEDIFSFSTFFKEQNKDKLQIHILHCDFEIIDTNKIYYFITYAICIKNEITPLNNVKESNSPINNKKSFKYIDINSEFC
ncbi:MAG: hypothetical protein ACRCW0_06085 [Clostridium sp.]